MLSDILFLLWILVPAMAANSTPVVVMKAPVINRWGYPADFYATFRGRRVLGDHKTIRGFVTGIVAAMAVALLQQFIYENSTFVQDAIGNEYDAFNPLILAFLAGLGALVGDSVKSFFKRQLNIQPGGTWIPFDQIDSIIGIFVFTLPYYQFEVWQYAAMFILWTVGHPISTIIGYLTNFKESPI